MNPELLEAIVKKVVAEQVAEHGEDVDPVQVKRRVEEAIILIQLEIKGRTQAMLAHDAELRANRNLE